MVLVKWVKRGRLKILAHCIFLFLATYPHCGNAMVFSDRLYVELPEQKIRFLPLYAAYAATLSSGRES